MTSQSEGFCLGCNNRPDCPTHGKYDDRIDKSIDRTYKVELTCVNHRELRWYTKNISHIGARSLFYNHETQGKECECPVSDLVLLSSLD